MKRLIYAEDAMHRIEMETRFYSGTYAEIERAIERAIDSAPTVDPRCLRPTAKWSLGRIEDHIVMNFICGNCGKRSELNYKYCPKCGARMIKNDKGW